MIDRSSTHSSTCGVAFQNTLNKSKARDSSRDHSEKPPTSNRESRMFGRCTRTQSARFDGSVHGVVVHATRETSGSSHKGKLRHAQRGHGSQKAEVSRLEARGKHARNAFFVWGGGSGRPRILWTFFGRDRVSSHRDHISRDVCSGSESLLSVVKRSQRLTCDPTRGVAGLGGWVTRRRRRGRRRPCS